MKLSILICTILGREKLLNHLLSILEKQMNDQVEIIIEKDNRRITIGAKRNILLERAEGDYICFIDDDDVVVDDYISKILWALKTNPDCCGIEGKLIRRKRTNLFIHSIQYKKWFQKDGVYYRCPNHLNPVRRKFALQVGFLNKSCGEDKDYSQGILPLLKSEVYIKEPIYFYQAG